MATLIVFFFSRDFPKMVLSVNECANAVYNTNHREFTRFNPYEWRIFGEQEGIF